MYNTTINTLEKSEIEIVSSIPAEEFLTFESKALSVISQRLEIPGFRKGKAPESVVKNAANEMMILEEMAELAIHTAYPKIIEEHTIDAIGRPEIMITKIARGSDLEFKIRTAVLPEMKLPNYKERAKKFTDDPQFKIDVVVDEAEVEKTILELRKMRAQQNKPQHEHEDQDASDHAHEEIPESEYPIFDDAFAKTFGDFENADALKEKIRSNLKIEKETNTKDKLRMAIIEDLVANTEGEIPEVLIEGETDKIMYRLQSDISQGGFKFEEYLTQINKTEQDLRTQWRPDAIKRAKLQMILQTILKKENLKPDESEIQKEVSNILEVYKDADPMRAQAYVENMLENEKVFKFLEEQ